MVYGYARVSTNGQTREGISHEAQVQAMQQAGSGEIFSDVFSGAENVQPQLEVLFMITFSEFERRMIYHSRI